jgi:hypothetical protein
LLNELKNKIETNNNISLDFDIQRYLNVDISDSNLYKQEFGIKDAIPISLNLKSFIFIKTSCIHGILHYFKLPIKTEIKWKIQGGIANGAFKIGNGMDAEYFSQDSGDSVIFYPQLQSDSKNLTYKKVCIELIVKQLGSSIFNEQEYHFFVNVNILISRKFAKRTFRIKMFVSRPERPSNYDNNNYDDNNHDNKIDNYILKPNAINSDDLESTLSTTTTTTANKIEKEEEREGKNHQISFKSINNSCKICNLSIIIKIKKHGTNHHPFSINALKSYLITSDIIKISAEESNNTKNSIDNHNNSSIILTGSHYKKYFIDGIQIQPRIFWKSNIGELVYGNLGQSLIYYTPGESKLSKSPVTINLYFHYDPNLEDLQEAILSDSKKLWMLRQEMCVHC